MGWTMLYLFLFLKLPILGAGYIVWWAIHQDGDEEEDAAAEGGNGGSRTRVHGRPRLPRSPRRGPHGDPALASPPRVRPVAPAVSAAAEQRRLEH